MKGYAYIYRERGRLEVEIERKGKVMLKFFLLRGRLGENYRLQTNESHQLQRL